MKRFNENKDSRINKLDNLTDEQKEEVKAFFRLHNEQEKKIDWNKGNSLQYSDFFTLIKNFNERFLPKFALNDLEEGVDYDYLGEDDNFKYYFIRTYKASVAFASNNIGFEVWSPLCKWYLENAGGEKTSWEENVIHDYPQRIGEDGEIEYGGAKWCISTNHTQKYWNDYHDNKCCQFIFAISRGTLESDNTYKYAIELNINENFKSYEIEKFYDAFDVYGKDTMIVNTVYNVIDRAILDVVKEIYKKEIKELEEAEAYKNDIPTKNYTFNGYDFPFIQVGERPEGKVFMSRYLTDMKVPFSPRYFGEKFKTGCSHWDISILRQWLNSDAPAGQWYKEYEVDGYKVDWDHTGEETKDFIKNTDGFLRLVGISKSDLNPVTNITYTSDGQPIETVDYVWIPSLSEMSTQSEHKEGEPLEYWKELLGENASWSSNIKRTLETGSNKAVISYCTRTIDTTYLETTNIIMSDGSVESVVPCFTIHAAVLACFK